MHFYVNIPDSCDIRVPLKVIANACYSKCGKKEGLRNDHTIWISSVEKLQLLSYYVDLLVINFTM